MTLCKKCHVYTIDGEDFCSELCKVGYKSKLSFWDAVEL